MHNPFFFEMQRLCGIGGIAPGADSPDSGIPDMTDCIQHSGWGMIADMIVGKKRHIKPAGGDERLAAGRDEQIRTGFRDRFPMSGNHCFPLNQP